MIDPGMGYFENNTTGQGEAIMLKSQLEAIRKRES